MCNSNVSTSYCNTVAQTYPLTVNEMSFLEFVWNTGHFTSLSM